MRWQYVDSKVRPEYRLNATLAEDPASGTVLLFGGGTSARECRNTWQLSRQQWTLIDPVAPEPLMSPTAVTTPDEVLVVGLTARHYAPSSAAPSQLWHWRGSSWTRETGNGPPGRFHSQMAYYPPDGSVVMFSGGAGPLAVSHVYEDTWVLAQGNWRQLSGSESPEGRVGGFMFWDEALEALVLLGGSNRVATVLNDVWLFRSGHWSRVATEDGPAPSGHLPGWAFDRSQERVVRYGGVPEHRGLTVSSGVWVWERQRWHEDFIEDGPGAPRISPLLCYESATGGVVMHGGVSRDESRDTWRLVS